MSLNICRACLSQQNKVYYPLSTKVNLQRREAPINFASMLSAVASIQVTKADGLPNVICKSCSKMLNLTFVFKQQCEQADLWLQEHFKNGSLETNVLEYETAVLEYETAVVEQTKDEDFKQKPILNNFPIFKNEPASDLHETELEPKASWENPKCSANAVNQAENLDDSPQKPIRDVTRIVKNNTSENQLRKTKVKHKNSKLTQSKCSESHKLHICKLCDRNFRSPHGLSYHMKQHQGIKKYVCAYENCGKSFILKQTLDKHETLHCKEKNYLCSLCGKPYNTADALSYHLKTHSGERPHLCMHCGKTFKQACHLKMHMWNHTGVKPYLCSACGRRYTSGHQLKKHLSKYCGIGKLPTGSMFGLKKVSKRRTTTKSDDCKKDNFETQIETKYVVIEAIVLNPDDP